jgi:hypothetical protein
MLMPYRDFKSHKEAMAFAKKKAQTSTTGPRHVTVSDPDTCHVFARLKKSNWHRR